MGTRTLSARISASLLSRYILAVLSALMALLVCSLLEPFLGIAGCYLLIFLAVAVSAWYCGIGPSIAAVVIGLAGATVGFAPKAHSFVRPSLDSSISMLVFVLCSFVVILLGEARLRENAALHQAQGELELRVRERTADLDAANGSLRDLSTRLMRLQDEERRRIARELHDSVGQTLAALAMNLALVRSDVERLSKIANALTDSESLVRDMSTEVRTISHLLHPPLLDEAGLSSAIHWYGDGFAKRSGIKVEIDVPEDLQRLPAELETAIFRVVQECLTNIHRHSGSPVARIRVRRHQDQVDVEVEDKGRGIPPEKQEEMANAGTPGVGIRGMRERIRQLGGTLDIQSNGKGTMVKLQLPVGDTDVGDALGTTPVAAA
ncbi:MAG TPA: sensor histidine kinase [Candidatus Sulfotelmatobacter sp.]|nr:sensor histidine kinase [Candidatus Sulfotelmatobacter sp.]